MKNSQIFIFTDLDGSLLNHNNFEFKEIKDFILAVSLYTSDAADE